MLRIGLTGGIGSGKSTVAAEFIACGAELIDTDAIARALTAPGGAALPAIAQAFGPAMIGADGALDRSRMREIAFSDATARRSLEAVLHPMIGAEALRRAEASRAPALVFDVPLLVESQHWRARVHRVLVVDCSEDTQVERVMRRSAWSEPAVRAVVAQQASRALRRAAADAVIANETLSLDELREQVRGLWKHWVSQGL